MVLIMLFSLRDTTTLSFRPSASRGNGCAGVRAVIRPTCFQGPSENATTSHVLIPRLRKSGTKSNINATDSISSNHRKCKMRRSQHLPLCWGRSTASQKERVSCRSCQQKASRDFYISEVIKDKANVGPTGTNCTPSSAVMRMPLMPSDHGLEH